MNKHEIFSKICNRCSKYLQNISKFREQILSAELHLISQLQDNKNAKVTLETDQFSLVSLENRRAESFPVETACEIDFEEFIDNTVIEQIDETTATPLITNDTAQFIVIEKYKPPIHDNRKPLPRIREKPITIKAPKGKMVRSLRTLPPLSIGCIIALALRNSRIGTLRLNDIYRFFSRHFMFYQRDQTDWKPWVEQTLLNSHWTDDELFKSKKGLVKRKTVRFWTMNEKFIAAMDKKIQSNVNSQIIALKSTMIHPENLERMLKGELKHGFKGDLLDCPEIDNIKQEHENVTESTSDED